MLWVDARPDYSLGLLKNDKIMVVKSFLVAFRAEVIVLATLTMVPVPQNWILLALITTKPMMLDVLILLVRTVFIQYFTFGNLGIIIVTDGVTVMILFYVDACVFDLMTNVISITIIVLSARVVFWEGIRSGYAIF